MNLPGGHGARLGWPGAGGVACAGGRVPGRGRGGSRAGRPVVRAAPALPRPRPPAGSPARRRPDPGVGRGPRGRAPGRLVPRRRLRRQARVGRGTQRAARPVPPAPLRRRRRGGWPRCPGWYG
ncbi:hypothetical protein ACFSTC_22465 [Nonomuraea ferruginea]